MAHQPLIDEALIDAVQITQQDASVSDEAAQRLWETVLDAAKQCNDDASLVDTVQHACKRATHVWVRWIADQPPQPSLCALQPAQDAAVTMSNTVCKVGCAVEAQLRHAAGCDDLHQPRTPHQRPTGCWRHSNGQAHLNQGPQAHDGWSRWVW